jgi:hypothetical protein
VPFYSQELNRPEHVAPGPYKALSQTYGSTATVGLAVARCWWQSRPPARSCSSSAC